MPFALVTARSITGPQSTTVAADADGAFQTRAPAGTLELHARSEAFSSALRFVEAPAQGVLLELGPSSELIGRVVRADTLAPLAGVKVSATPERLADFGGEPSRESPGSASTSANGEFRIAGLRGGGSYGVAVADASWQSTEHSVLVEVGAASAPVLLAARRAVTLSARVLRDGEPCPDGIVRVAGAREWSTPIEEDGMARVLGLEPGPHAVDVFCAQSLPHHSELVLAGSVTHELRVSSGASVSGRVLDARGRPLPGTKVSVRPRGAVSGEKPGSVCASDERGEFVCAGLEPGEHDCSVVDPLDAAPEVVQLAEVPARGVVLHVRPLASVRVLLVGDARARSEARVLLRGPTAFPISGKPVDDFFVFERLPLARYEVYVDQPTTQERTSELELTEDGQELTLELSAPPRAFITGLVVDESGEPLADQWISVSAADPLASPRSWSEPQALSDASGAFVLSAVSGGVYDLSIDTGLGSAHTYGVLAGSDDVVLRVVATTAAAEDPLVLHPEQ